MLAEQIVNGIVLGSMYALVALGYTLVFGVLDKLNFALSELFMLGGFIVLAGVGMGAPLWVAALAVLVICGLLGLVVEFVSFRKFTSADAQTKAKVAKFLDDSEKEDAAPSPEAPARTIPGAPGPSPSSAN